MVIFYYRKSRFILPNGWPNYFSKTKGCEVWDIDGNKFYDFSLMGVGTNILGYSNDKIDKAVKRVINSGNMSTLNSKEGKLAQKLIDIHPWAKMVRFVRTGGEANAVAIRIARVYSKKDNIALWLSWMA